MKIGILGVGLIGTTLTQRLSAAEHDVKVANSRGPETIEAETLASGGRAVSAAEAVVDVDVIILSIPLNRIPGVAPLFTDVPAETVVIDTSNYYPARDERIEAIEGGQVESLWVTEQLGRPVVKAWNAIGSDSFARKHKPAGDPARIAIPVAADSDTERRVGMALVEDTGFDAVDAGHRRSRCRAAGRIVAPATGNAGVLHRPDPRAGSGRTCGSGRGAITQTARPGGRGDHGKVRTHRRSGYGVRRPPQPCVVHVTHCAAG